MSSDLSSDLNCPNCGQPPQFHYMRDDYDNYCLNCELGYNIPIRPQARVKLKKQQEKIITQPAHNFVGHKKCNFCHKMMLYQGDVNSLGNAVYYPYYCENCDVYYSPFYRAYKRGELIRYYRNRGKNDLEYAKIKFSDEQIRLVKELDEKREPAIKIDKDFHELYCTVLKQETNRECDCHGVTSEIRKS